LFDRAVAAFSRRPAAFQIGLLFVATALPLIVASGFMFVSLAWLERVRLCDELLVRARTLAALVDDEIAMHAAIGWSLAASSQLSEDDLPGFRAEAEAAVKFVPGSWLALKRPDGQVVLDTRLPPGTPLPAYGMKIARQATATRKPVVVDLTLGPVSTTLAPYVEVPVFRNGSEAYSISVVMDPARFLALFKEKVADGELVALVDRNKRFIARIPDHDRHLGQLAGEGWRAAMAKSPEGWTDSRTLEGTYALTAYAPTDQGWTVGIAIPEDQLAAPARRLLYQTAAVAIGLLALSVGLASLIALRINRGMSALACAAERVGAGEMVEAPEAPFAEARAIGAALACASAELKRRADLLARDKKDLEAEVSWRSEELRREAAHKARIEEQLRQSQKMDALGKLAGGVAHDFNNVLTVIVSSLETLKRRLDEGDANRRIVDAALRASDKAAGLTRRLLAFARQQPLEPAIVDLNGVIHELCDFLRSTLGVRIELEMKLADDLWLVNLDPRQFEHALVNLVANARDAMESGGRLTIETRNAEPDKLFAAQTTGASAVPSVVVTVKDTGHGMDAETLARAFEPFFTTKPTGKGTGLGLSQVHGFIEQSGGHLEVWSEPGRGATIQLWFPRSQETEAPSVPAQASQTSAKARDGETVLVVEDEDGVRAAVTRALRDLGYATLEANGGDEALRVSQRFDLVLSDVVMPGLSGFELVERMRARREGLPTILMTGHVPRSVLSAHDPESILRKPFTFEQLAMKVREALDAHHC
jgi:signal transduction histidine kinase